MTRPTRRRLAALALGIATALGCGVGESFGFGTDPARAEDAAALSQAWRLAGAKDWAGADAAARASGPVAIDLVTWQRLRAGQGTWADYRDFAARNADWPGMDLLFARGDAVLRPGLPAAEVIAWFGERRPATLAAERAFLAALDATDRDAAAAEAVRFWTETPLDPADQAAFVAPRAAALAPHHEARLARLLDLKEWRAAEAMVRPGADAPALVTGPAADLARARIAVQAGRPGVDPIVKALPDALRNDAGLAMDRFDWRVRAKQTDLARALLLERSTSAEALRDPARWADFRVDHARAALRAGDWALAERLARNHFLTDQDGVYADLEWLAGYAALRAGAPDRALARFQHLQTVVGSPISKARALYWQGRAMEAEGDAQGSTAAYAQAARHQSAFYGQLAAEKLGLPMDPALALPGAAIDSLPDWRGAALRDDGVWQAALWLVAAGDPVTAQRFLLHKGETAAVDDIGRMARLMLELGRPWDALRLAKQAAGKGGVFPAAYYPLTGLETHELGLPAELVLAIARQESEFNHAALSHVGARGLMQVMPDTARDMARRLGEPFELARLTVDGTYNARLGAAYLDGLRDRFGPSIALVAAGYNAGPGRSSRWLRDFGDLRVPGAEGTDPVDWVEMIPFDETRNYVMRVGEALPIYRARIAGKPVPFVPTWDLRGGGIRPVAPVSPLRLAISSRPPSRPAVPADEVAAASPGMGAPAIAYGGGTPATVVPSVGYPAHARPDLGAGLRRLDPPIIAAGTAGPALPAGPAGTAGPAAAAPATR